MCIYLRAPVQEVQEHKVHSPRANSQQFPLSSTVADVPAQARDNRGLYAKDTLEQAGVSSLVHALFFFFFSTLCPQQDRTNRTRESISRGHLEFPGTNEWQNASFQIRDSDLSSGGS